MQSEDGHQSLESQDRGNDGLDWFETTSNVSCMTGGEHSLGDEETLPCEDGQDSSHYGQPPERDKYQEGIPPPVVDRSDHNAPGWAYKYNNRHENGNCGWAFGNGGARAKNKDKQAYIDKLMKRLPAQILGLAECDHDTELMLRQPGEPSGENSAWLEGIEATLARPSYEYLTIRGSEKHSLLLGVRRNNCRSLQLKEFVVRDEGTYQRQGAKTKVPARTRALIAEVSTNNNVGFIGDTHTVMVVHLHFTVAKAMQGKRERKKAFIDWFIRTIVQYDVKVVMGDFNMAFWEVAGWVRDRESDMPIDLAAWFGWKSLDGLPCSDSCGIWLLKTPGLYNLVKTVDCIIEDDDGNEASLLTVSKTQDLTTPLKEDAGGWPRFARNGGPGAPLHCYQPETHHNNARSPPTQHIRASLTPSEQSAVWRSRYTHGGLTETGIKECFRAKQVPLQYEGFCSDKFGTQGGAHYPICVMTNNNSCRAPPRHMARHRENDRRMQKRGLLEPWTPVVHNDTVQDTAVAEGHSDQPERTQRYPRNQPKPNAWEQWNPSRKHHDTWWGSWKEEGNREWNNKKENHYWNASKNDWGTNANGDNAQSKWGGPMKIGAPPGFDPNGVPPKPVPSPVPSPAAGPPAAEPLLAQTADDKPMLELPRPLPLPAMQLPLRTHSSYMEWTAEGFRVTETWICDGRWGCHSTDYPFPKAENPYYQDLRAETTIQPYEGVGGV